MVRRGVRQRGEFVEWRGYTRAVSILYQYEIQTGSIRGGVGERVADTNCAVQFCIPFGHQGNRTRRRNPLKPSETNSIEENAESRALSLSTFLFLSSPLLSSLLVPRFLIPCVVER